MDNKVRITKIIGILGILITIILILYFGGISGSIIAFSNSYLSKDHHIGTKSILIVKTFIAVSISLIFIISIILLFNLTKKVFYALLKFFQLNDDPEKNICKFNRMDLYIFLTATILGILQIIVVLVFGEPFDKSAQPLTLAEGKLEILFALILFFSIILLLYSIKFAIKNISPGRTRKNILFSLIFIFTIVFFVFGEEISWGQQIFKWDTPDIISAANFQNETNLHNYFNPYMKYLYPLVGTGFFIILFIMWLIPKLRNSYLFNIILPHPSLFFLALTIMISSFLGGGGETFEQLITIFGFLYSFRIFMCLKYQNT